MDGLSVHGKRDVSNNLKDYSELCNILHSGPLKAISSSFCKAVLTFEGVAVKYCTELSC